MHCLERKEKLGYIIRKFFELFGGAESSLVVEGTSPVRSWLKKTASYQLRETLLGSLRLEN